MISNNCYSILILFLSFNQFFVDGAESYGEIVKRQLTGGWRRISSIFKLSENRKPANGNSETTNFERIGSDTTGSENGELDIIEAKSISLANVPLSEVLEYLDQSRKTCSEKECKATLETIQKLQSFIRSKEDEVPIIHKGQRRKVSLKSIGEGERNQIIKNAIIGIFTSKKKPKGVPNEPNSENKSDKGQQSPMPLTPGGISSSIDNKSSYYRQTQGTTSSANDPSASQVKGVNPSTDEAVPHQNMNFDEISRKVQIAENSSDGQVDGEQAEMIISNFWHENFEPCNEQEAGRIVGVDSIEEDGKKA